MLANLIDSSSLVQEAGVGNVISQYLYPLFEGNVDMAHIIERAAWWIHIAGILVFNSLLAVFLRPFLAGYVFHCCCES